jgi:integrase
MRQWQDLDQDRGIIHVRRQLSRSGGKFTEQKTRAAKRSIELGTGTLDLLKEHYQRQIQERYIAGDHWKENDLIFTSTIGTPLNFKNMIERHFKPMIKSADVPVIRFHDLRHTAVATMLSRGILIFIVSKYIGHARASITSDIYGHLLPGANTGIPQVMDEIVKPVELISTENSIFLQK